MPKTSFWTPSSKNSPSCPASKPTPFSPKNWASKSGYPEGLDFITHSWFRLDGGPTPKTSLQVARISVLTTKADRSPQPGPFGSNPLSSNSDRR